MLGQQILNGLVSGSVYALFALGLTLVFGVHHILNLAHGAVFMWGAFVGLYCVTVLEMPFPAVLVIAAVAAGLLSIVIDVIAFRPLRRRGAPEFAAIITSIGAGMILTNLAQRASDTKVWRYPFGTFPIHLFEVGGLRITLLQIVIVGSVAIILAALIFYLFGTAFGQRIRAVAIDERMAGLVGINADVVYLQTFFISGALAGIAGVLIGIVFNSVQFLMGEPYMLRAFVIIVLGGLGSLGGAVIAGLALGVVHTLTVAYISADPSDAIIFTILFLALLLRPSGFFGNLRLEKRVTRE